MTASKENPRKGFTFLLSFYEATRDLNDTVRLECLDTIIRYGLYNEDKTDSDIAKVILAMAKPTIDAANNRYAAAVENGKKGGAPKGNKNASKKKQPENNQNLTSEQPENNLNKDKDTDKDMDKDTVSVSLSDTDTEQADAVSADRPAVAAADGTAAPQSGDLFSVEQILETVKRNKVSLDRLQYSGQFL